MHWKAIRSITAVIAVAALAACAADEPEIPRQPFQADGVEFSLTPSAARDCDPATLYQAVLHWNVQRAGRNRVEVRIDSPDGPLLARSDDATGSAETGDWVKRGMWFLLLDRDRGTVLAAQRAGPHSCD